MKRLISASLIIFFLFPTYSSAAGPVQLLQGECPSAVQELQHKRGLPSKANAFLPGLLSANQDVKTWQIISISPLKKSSPYYKPALKTCKKKVADHTYLIDVLVTKKSAQLPSRMHLFAARQDNKWTIWGLSSY